MKHTTVTTARLAYRQAALAALCLLLSFAPMASGLDDLTWMVGVWRGHNGADAIQDVFLPPKSGEMVSVFTAETAGAVTRYEIRTFRVEQGSLVLREAAYGPGLEPGAPVPDRTVTASDATHVTYVESGQQGTGNYREASIVHAGGDRMMVTLRIHATGTAVRTIRMELRRSKKFVAQ
jgi:hypothetical protein